MFVLLDVYVDCNDDKHAHAYAFETRDEALAYCRTRDEIFQEYDIQYRKCPHMDMDLLQELKDKCRFYMDKFGHGKIPYDVRRVFQHIRWLLRQNRGGSRDLSYNLEDCDYFVNQVDCGFRFGPFAGYAVSEDMINNFVCDCCIFRTHHNLPQYSVLYVVLDIYHDDEERHARSYHFNSQCDCIAYCKMRKDVYTAYSQKKQFLFLSEEGDYHAMIEFDAYCKSYIDRFGLDKIPDDIRQIFSKTRHQISDLEMGSLYEFGPLGGCEIFDSEIDSFVADYWVHWNQHEFTELMKDDYVANAK